MSKISMNNFISFIGSLPIIKKSSTCVEIVCVPFQTNGSLQLFSPNRFLASTDSVLPQGVCGGPIISKKHDNDHDNNICCGIVEGIVPQTHEDKRLAGSASFIPSHTIKHFIDAAEQFMLQQIVPEHLYEAIDRIKQGHHSTSVDSTIDDKQPQPQQTKTKFDPKAIQKEYNNVTKHLQDKYTPEVYAKIEEFINKQRQEVIEKIDTEGGDLDEIVKEVATKNIQQLKDENERSTQEAAALKRKE